MYALPQNQIKLRHYVSSIIQYICESQTLRRVIDGVRDGWSLTWRKRCNATWYNVDATSRQPKSYLSCTRFPNAMFSMRVCYTRKSDPRLPVHLNRRTDGSCKTPPATYARRTSCAILMHAINTSIPVAWLLQVLLCERSRPNVSASLWNEKRFCQHSWWQSTASNLPQLRRRLSCT